MGNRSGRGGFSNAINQFSGFPQNPSDPNAAPYYSGSASNPNVVPRASHGYGAQAPPQPYAGPVQPAPVRYQSPAVPVQPVPGRPQPHVAPVVPGRPQPHVAPVVPGRPQPHVAPVVPGRPEPVMMQMMATTIPAARPNRRQARNAVNQPGQVRQAVNHR